jgi:hypothetical protein
VNGYVALAEKDRSPPPQVGDFVTVEILLDEKVGGDTDEWKVLSEAKWLPSGGITLSLPSLRVLPNGNLPTKLAIDGIVHQPGALSTGEFTLKHQPTGQEVKVAAGSLSAEVAQVEKKEMPWVLPALPFGGWNYFLIVIVGAVLLAGLALLIRKLLTRVARRRRKNHKDRALASLQSLQKYARSKNAMKQEEWKKFSFELAGIVRKFSDENFKIDSSDMTDREFLAELRLQPRARPQVDSLSRILSTIDEVRYGKKALEVTHVPDLLLETRKFIENTYDAPEGEK